MAEEPLYLASAFWKATPDGVEVWGLNNCFPPAWHEGVISAWFQMHSEKQWRGGRNPGFVQWAKSPRLFPIFMQSKHDDIPASQEYPLAEAEKLWPFGGEPVFSNTFCYMVAKAILDKRTAIDVSAIHLANDIEVYTEAPWFAMWLVIAQMNGIRVIGSRFLEPFLYGYEERVPGPLLPQDIAAQLIVDETLAARKKMQKWQRSRY